MPAPKDPQKYNDYIERLKKSHTGYVMPQSQKDKMSLANKGIRRHSYNQEFREKQRIIATGKKVSESTKRKMSETQKRIGNKPPVHIGKDNFNWKGGVSQFNRTERQKDMSKIEYRLWHKACWERDDFTCQKTGIRGGNLVAHHINNYKDFPELRTSLENGITLSEKAHKEFHSKYGKTNN